MDLLWLGLGALAGLALGYALAPRGALTVATPTRPPDAGPPRPEAEPANAAPELKRRLADLAESYRCRQAIPDDPTDPRALCGFIIALADAARDQTRASIADVIRVRIARVTSATDRAQFANPSQATQETQEHLTALVGLLEDELKTSLRPK